MIRHIAFLSALICLTGCDPHHAGAGRTAMNSVEGVDTQHVIYDGQPWVEITITQRVDPKSPAYVVGIRDSKWANRLRWALVEQKLDAKKVTTRFRRRPVDAAAELSLDRDDFEWYPYVSGFEHVTVALKNAESAASPSAAPPHR
jgi:hypothetical protein